MMELLVNRINEQLHFQMAEILRLRKNSATLIQKWQMRLSKITGSRSVPAVLCWVEFHFGLFVGVIPLFVSQITPYANASCCPC